MIEWRYYSQLKIYFQIGSSHPTGLTPNLLKLFEPRPPLEYKPPPEKRKCPPYTGKKNLWTIVVFARSSRAHYKEEVYGLVNDFTAPGCRDGSICESFC